jgi:hypothetical protein
MPTGKKDMERLRKGYKEEFAALEAKCAAGNASKADYEALTKLRRKMK